MLGVNSAVTRTSPAYSMIGGAPARLLRTFDHTTHAWVAPQHVHSEDAREGSDHPSLSFITQPNSFA